MDELKQITCCFTGHRDIPMGQHHIIMWRLETEIEKRIAMGYRIFCAGGALGFDTMAEQAVVKAKKNHPDKKIELHLYLPRSDISDKWSQRNKDEFDRLVIASDKVFCASKKTNNASYFMRNRQMVEASSCCIAYCTQATGGTAYTLGFAIDKGLDTFNIGEIV